MSFTAQHRGGSGEPLLLVHGFTDTWRTWDLVLPALEAQREVLAPTLIGHAGGPELPEGAGPSAVVDGIERAMDEAGWETAHVAGNSLGGWVALQLAARGRARSVVALAPAGGWEAADGAQAETMRFFVGLHEQVQAAVPFAEQFLSTPEGRRQATLMTTVAYEHLPQELLVHQLKGMATCAVPEMVAGITEDGWALDAAAIECPVRIVWGTEDKLLAWPTAAARYREALPHADWVVLDDVGHCPQLDRPTEAAQLILG